MYSAKILTKSMRFRFALMAFSACLLGLSSIWQGVDAALTGEMFIHFSKSHHGYTVNRTEDTVAFYLWVFFDIAIGAFLLFLTLFACRLLTKKQDQVIHSFIGRLEQQAPSGLRPLWIGLFVTALLIAAFLWLSITLPPP
jgi:hypothetical protein